MRSRHSGLPPTPEEPLATFALEPIGAQWVEREVEFKNTGHSGWATFALMLPPGTELMADDFSLLPSDHYHGWRPEIIEPLKEIGPPVLRIPGGCFASFYDWRDGIGPFSQSKPQPSYFWGGQNYNDVGVAELAMLAKAMGSEVMYCVNVFHPLKQKYEWHFGEENVRVPGPHGFDFPQFTDIAQGAKEAANLVAYCNLPAGSHPMADLRASHGYKEPFGFKFWELDNEVHRWFEPDEYARAAIIYSEAMKAVDPSIKIGLVTYGERFGPDGKPRVHYHDEESAMLEICGKHIDFLADRGPSSKGYLDQIIGWMNDYNAKSSTSIIYCETEKLFYEQHPDVENRVKPDGGYTKSFMFSKWFYAQKAIMDYMAYQRSGGDIDFVIFNNLANTHSQRCPPLSPPPRPRPPPPQTTPRRDTRLAGRCENEKIRRSNRSGPSPQIAAPPPRAPSGRSPPRTAPAERKHPAQKTFRSRWAPARIVEEKLAGS